MGPWKVCGNGNAKQANWKQWGSNATMNQAPAIYNMQRELSAMRKQLAGQLGSHKDQGKGQGKGADPGKGNGKGKGKGKDKGRVKTSPWASYKAYSTDGTQVLVMDHNRAYLPSEQPKLDAEIAKLSKAAGIMADDAPMPDVAEVTDAKQLMTMGLHPAPPLAEP